MERGHRKTVVGRVVSNKMDKTISVEVERLVKHPQYGKFMRKYTVLKAHDEKDEAHTGDKVEIMETRPLSKSKRWRLLQILVKSDSVELEGGKQP